MKTIFEIILLECFFLRSRIVLYYKTILWKFLSWRLHREIAKYKRQVKFAGLPSLDEYTDEQIVEGIRRSKQDVPWG